MFIFDTGDVILAVVVTIVVAWIAWLFILEGFAWVAKKLKRKEK